MRLFSFLIFFYFLSTTFCLTCPDGTYYLLGLVPTCLPCPSPCSKCTGLLGVYCTDCPANHFLYSGDCYANCASNQYFDTTAKKCTSCDPSCLSCSGSGSSSCTSCLSGSLTLGSCTCPAQSYKDSSYICQSCDATCLTCNGPSATDCSVCQVGMTKDNGVCECPSEKYFDSTTKTCRSCDSTCDFCTGSGTNDCQICKNTFEKTVLGGCECPIGTYLNTAVPNCLACPSGCDSCDSTLGATCDTCSNGYFKYSGVCYADCTSHQYFSLNPLGCIECDPSCKTCFGSVSNTCSSCYDGNLLLGSCQCPSGTYPDANYICQPCDETCSTCDGPSSTECLTCLAGMDIDNGECKCPVDTTFDSSSKTCIGCGSTCLVCDGTTCTDCINNLELNAQGGCECPTGKFLSASSTCEDCTGNCASCSGNLGTTCNKCDDGFLLYLGICYPGCTSSEYFDTGVLDCEDCNPACDTCFGSTSSSCSSCKSGNLVLGSCVCPTGTYKDSNYICQSCDSSCLTCDGPSGSNCLSCRSGMTFSSGDKTCTCPSGRYFESSTKTCRACDSSCATCTGSASNQCSTCSNNLVKTAQGICQCPTAKYLDTGSNTCMDCPGNCGSCSGVSGSICNSCKSGFIFYQGTCYPECSLSTEFFNTGTLTCESCDPVCETCSGSSSSSCLTCKSGNIVLGSCVCPTGTYKDSNYECQSCDSSCSACDGPLETDCTGCKSGTVVNGACTCPTGTYQDSGYNCQNCDGSCSTCDGPLSSDCTACKSGETVVNGACACPTGTYQDSGYNCQGCDGSCSTCNGPLSSDCTACPSGVAPQNGVCKTSPSIICATGCDTCLGTSKNECMTCLDGYLFLENSSTSMGTCVQDCPMYYFKTTDGKRGICAAKQRINNLISYGTTTGVTKVIIQTGTNLKNKFSKIKEGMSAVIKFRSDQAHLDYAVSISQSSMDIVIDIVFPPDGHLLPRNNLYITYGDYRDDDSTPFYLANNPQQVTLLEYYKYSESTQKIINGTSTANSVVSQANQVFSWVSSGLIRSLHAMRSELVEDMMGYFLYINTDLPPNFVQFLEDRDGSPMDALYEKINLFFHDDGDNDVTGAVGENTRILQETEDEERDDAFARYLETRSFWGNFGDKLPFFFIVFGLLGVIEILRKITPAKEKLQNKKMRYFLRRILDSVSMILRWNFILNEVIGAYLDLLFASLLQISSNGERDSASLRFEYAVAVFALLFCLFGVIGIFILTKRIHKAAQNVEPEDKEKLNDKEEVKSTTMSHQTATTMSSDEEMLKRYEFMNKDFETEKLVFLIYPFLMILRSFGYMFVLVFGQGSATGQVVYVLLSTLFIIVYLGYYRPLEEKYHVFVTMAYEVMLCISCLILLILTVYNKSNLDDIQTRTNFGFALCVASLMIMALNITNMVVEIAELREHLTCFKRSKTPSISKIVPLTSPSHKAMLKSSDCESDLESCGTANTLDLGKKLEFSPQKALSIKGLEPIEEEYNTKRSNYGLTPPGASRTDSERQIYLNFSSINSKQDLGRTLNKMDSVMESASLMNTSPFSKKIGHFLVNKESILIKKPSSPESSSGENNSSPNKPFMPIKSHLLFEKMNKHQPRPSSSRVFNSSRNELLFDRSTSRIQRAGVSHLMLSGTFDDLDAAPGANISQREDEDPLKNKFSLHYLTPKGASYWQKSMISPKDFMNQVESRGDIDNKIKRESPFNFPIEENEGSVMTFTTVTGEEGRKTKTVETRVFDDYQLPNTIVYPEEEEEKEDTRREHLVVAVKEEKGFDEKRSPGLKVGTWLKPKVAGEKSFNSISNYDKDDDDKVPLSATFRAASPSIKNNNDDDDEENNSDNDSR